MYVHSISNGYACFVDSFFWTECVSICLTCDSQVAILLQDDASRMEDFNMLMHQSVRDGGLCNPYSCTWRCCASQHKHLASILHLPRCDGSWLLSFTSPHASTWHQFCASIHQYINPSIQKLCSSHFSIASPLHTLAYHTWVSHTHLSMILRTVKKCIMGTVGHP